MTLSHATAAHRADRAGTVQTQGGVGFPCAMRFLCGSWHGLPGSCATLRSLCFQRRTRLLYTRMCRAFTKNSELAPHFFRPCSRLRAVIPRTLNPQQWEGRRALPAAYRKRKPTLKSSATGKPCGWKPPSAGNCTCEDGGGSGGRRRPGGACPTGLWHKNVCIAYPLGVDCAYRTASAAAGKRLRRPALARSIRQRPGTKQSRQNLLDA